MKEKTTTLVPDFKANGLWVKYLTLHGKRLQTISGRVFQALTQRSDPNGYTQRMQPTYRGCTSTFKDFDSFTNWHIKQVGYGLGYHLDADMLGKGNKVYSEETCLLVPSYINEFFKGSKGNRGKFPEGLFWHTRDQHLRVQITSAYHGGKRTQLGVFQMDGFDTARELYRVEKNKACKYLKEKLIADNTIIDPRVLSAIDKWEHICDWKGFN